MAGAIVFKGIPENVPDNTWKCTVVSVLLDIDVEVWAKGYWGTSSNWQANLQNTDDNCEIY